MFSYFTEEYRSGIAVGKFWLKLSNSNVKVFDIDYIKSRSSETSESTVGRLLKQPCRHLIVHKQQTRTHRLNHGRCGSQPDLRLRCLRSQNQQTPPCCPAVCEE